jgi:hypothetical protein
MSSALGRRITEFSRSIDEKLEMVSMSIDGFHESCIRIQDGAPLIEDYIADLLMKILDTVDNRYVRYVPTIRQKYDSGLFRASWRKC